MKYLITITLFCLIFVSLNCSSISVRHDYDPDVDFSQFKTFNFMKKPKLSPESLLDKRVKNALQSELEAKGLQKSRRPDFLIAYHSNVRNKVDVTAWGYRYRPRWGTWGARGVTVDRYKQGTLIVDFIERESKEMIWRGAATSALDRNPSPEKVTKHVNKSVQKMLVKFPPGN